MIAINAREAIAELLAMAARIARPRPLLDAIGRAQEARVEQRIRSAKVSPDSSPWAPWQPSTRAHRERKGNAGQGLLWDEGDLLDSVHSEVGDNDVRIGVDPFYGRFLQDGTERMAARPFLGWSEADDNVFEHLTVRYIETGSAK